MRGNFSPRNVETAVNSVEASLAARPGENVRLSNRYFCVRTPGRLAGHSRTDVSVLVVDDEASVLSTLHDWLAAQGMTVICAQNTSAAIAAVERYVPSLAIVDYWLSEGQDGIKLGRDLRIKCGVPFVLISGYLSTSVIVAGMRAGAFDVMEKPLDKDRFLRTVDGVLLGEPLDCLIEAAGRDHSDRSCGSLHSPVTRWSHFVLTACEARWDPRTVALWAREVGTSEGVIEEVCRRCELIPRDARDLARFLRAVSRSAAFNQPLRLQFDVADHRTLRRLFDRAQLQFAAVKTPLREFLLHQTFIPVTHPCLRHLAHSAANSKYFIRQVSRESGPRSGSTIS